MTGRTRIRIAATVSLAIATIAGLAIPANSQFLRTIEGRVTALDLPTIAEDGVVIAYSEGVAEEAAFYAAEAEAAAAWYRSVLDWDAPILMAVLDAEDFARTTSVPYPSPHAEIATGFIVIADRVESHPGFDFWDIAGRDINAAWLFHEMGHVIARQLGVASNNLWVNELIASVIMAGYVREERPEFGAFQDGMPPRFAGEGNYATLAEFDRLYFAMGQFDYLWFHFHIAEIADYVVAGAGGLAPAMDGLAAAFPIGLPPETIAATLEKLEAIAPGVMELAAPLAP